MPKLVTPTQANWTGIPGEESGIGITFIKAPDDSTMQPTLRVTER